MNRAQRVISEADETKRRTTRVGGGGGGGGTHTHTEWRLMVIRNTACFYSAPSFRYVGWPLTSKKPSSFQHIYSCGISHLGLYIRVCTIYICIYIDSFVIIYKYNSNRGGRTRLRSAVLPSRLLFVPTGGSRVQTLDERTGRIVLTRLAIISFTLSLG